MTGDGKQGEFQYTDGETVWGDNADKENSLYHNIQIDIGVDTRDIWMVFNKETSAVQLTHDDCRRLIRNLQVALNDAIPAEVE
jgi:hypothetical protein